MATCIYCGTSLMEEGQESGCQIESASGRPHYQITCREYVTMVKNAYKHDLDVALAKLAEAERQRDEFLAKKRGVSQKLIDAIARATAAEAEVKRLSAVAAAAQRLENWYGGPDPADEEPWLDLHEALAALDAKEKA